MLSIAIVLENVINPFACLFNKPTWKKMQVLLMGAILSPKKRTITAALRVMGRAQENDFAKYHQVLIRAVWSVKAVAVYLACCLRALIKEVLWSLDLMKL